MYERFTDRARQVMQLANQEAQRFQHGYIGTEHLLLGLIKDGTGVSAQVLKRLNVDWRWVRLEIEKIVLSGPDPVSLGKLPLTPRTKQVLQYAWEEAQSLNIGVKPDNTQSGVGFVHSAIGLDAQVGLGQALARTKSGFALVTGAGINAIENDHGFA